MKVDADKNISLQCDQSLERVAQRKKSFQNKVLLHNAIACQSVDGSFDSKNAINESEDNLVALNAQGAIQEMLVAQMTSIHQLQQKTIALANRTGLHDAKQYLTNSTIKLTNCFTQQAALLAKLQGMVGQKITVEHVEIHQGGQAVVGNVQGVTRLGE
jgi:hypothetical protein